MAWLVLWFFLGHPRMFNPWKGSIYTQVVKTCKDKATVLIHPRTKLTWNLKIPLGSKGKTSTQPHTNWLRFHVSPRGYQCQSLSFRYNCPSPSSYPATCCEVLSPPNLPHPASTSNPQQCQPDYVWENFLDIHLSSSHLDLDAQRTSSSIWTVPTKEFMWYLRYLRDRSKSSRCSRAGFCPSIVCFLYKHIRKVAPQMSSIERSVSTWLFPLEFFSK